MAKEESLKNYVDLFDSINAKKQCNESGEYWQDGEGFWWQRRRKVHGRLWGCSHALSRACKTSLVTLRDQDGQIYNHLTDSLLPHLVIESKPKGLNLPQYLGDLYLPDRDTWQSLMPPILREVYNTARFNVRHNTADVLPPEDQLPPIVEPPPESLPFVQCNDPAYQLPF
jgi:hypothetical protein